MSDKTKTTKKKSTKSRLPKEFEQQIFKDFSKVEGVSIDRIPDQVTKYKGSSSNICDYLVYKYPKLVYLECKTVHGDRLAFSNIRDNQWKGLTEKSQIPGVTAGVICWWVDRDVTLFFPIKTLIQISQWGDKSVRYDVYDKLLCDKFDDNLIIKIEGKKKRVLFNYDFSEFFSKI